jgi:hypothetical protein
MPSRQAAGAVLTAKQAPHRPGTAPALGLRAGEVARTLIPQTASAKEIQPMWLTSILDNLQSASPRTRAGRRLRAAARNNRPATRLSLECLEDRCLPSFLAPVSYATASSYLAGDVVTADFNGNGRLDLAVLDYSSNTVTVVLGNGDGTFQPAKIVATGLSPGSLAVGDFNGDGKLDLVTANANDMSVLLGNGDGTFQTATTFGIGSNPLSAAVGDFNDDGKLDLAVLSYFGGDAYAMASFYANVLLGNGDGTFSGPSATALAGGDINSVAVADFNSDGKLDFATANYDLGTASVLLGDGLGNLQPATEIPTGSDYPTSVVAGDVNGDGNIDLVTTNGYVPYAQTNTVNVLMGDGHGSFGSAQIYPVGPYPDPVVLGDVNRDGQVDLILTASLNSNRYVGVLLGGSGGAFTAPQYFGAGNGPSLVGAGDFNGDGWLDVAASNYFTDSVSVLINDTNWSATSAPASSFAVSGFPSPTTAGVVGTFTVTAEDADGAAATGYAGTLHFSSSDAQAGLPPDYTFTASDQGTHTFSATLKTAGTQSLTVTDTTTAGLTGGDTGITVTPAAASHLAVSAPAGSTAGSQFSVTLTARDPYNNTATGYTGTVHFTSTDGQASLPGDYTFTVTDASVHAFGGVILKTAGSQTVTASDTVSRVIKGSAAVVVSPAGASTMTVAGFRSPTTAGVAGGFTVTFKDPYGNRASGYTGSVHFTCSDGKASLPANYTFTAADAGVHTFSATLKTAGTQSISVTDTTTPSITGTDGGITVNAAAASQFILSAPSSVTAGAPFSLTVTVEDAYGNVVTGYTGTINIKSTDRMATLPADYTFTATDQGMHTFTGLVLRKKGNQKITITDTQNSSLIGSVIVDVL